MKERLSLWIGVVTALFLVTGCSSDDDYRSVLPTFSDITVKTVSGSSTINAGDSVIATVQYANSGKFIHVLSLGWSSDDQSGTSSTTGGVPSWKFKAPSVAGTYTVTFNGKYSVDGQMPNTPGNVTNEDFTVNYTGVGQISASVTVTKTYKVN